MFGLSSFSEVAFSGTTNQIIEESITDNLSITQDLALTYVLLVNQSISLSDSVTNAFVTLHLGTKITVTDPDRDWSATLKETRDRSWNSPNEVTETRIWTA